MKKLLITGASGFLGSYLCDCAVMQGWTVYGTRYLHQPKLKHVTLYPVDLTDRDAIQRLLLETQPQAIIHAAAMGRPNDCQRNPASSYDINVVATETIAKLCHDLDIKLVFISTEQVFDGQTPPYSELDSVSPINIYGEHKAIAEQKVLAMNPNNLVCRMPLMFGMVPHAPSFLQECLEKLDKGDPLTLFVDEIRTPLFGGDAAKGILLGLAQCSGILHLAGPEILSRYEFGQKIISILGLSDDCLSALHQTEITFAAPRPVNLTMRSEVLPLLGYMPQPVSHVLKSLLRK